jgi:hypothetical protein
MLRAMTIPGAAAGLLLAAALALGVLLALVAPSVRARRRRSTPAAPPPPDLPDDDLPGFLAAPPGSDGHRPRAGSGWAVLTPPPGPAPVPTFFPRPRTGRPALIAGLLAFVLVAAAVAVTAASRARPAPAPLSAASRGTRADLTFTGVVLERRAIGVTAAYAHVRVSDEAGASSAHLELVTFNCLADAAPPDPVAAGCSRVVPQYADLASPALRVTRSPAGGLTLRGRFPTYVRPNGTPATPTGAVYDLRIEVAPAAAEPPGVDVPAVGVLRLGDDEARTTGVSVLRLER